MSKIFSSLVFVAGSVASSFAGAMELLTNPDLDFPNAPPGWTLLETGGTPPTPREAAKQQDFADQDGGGLGLWLEAFQGQFFGNGAEPVSAVLRQTVPFSGGVGENYTFSGYSQFDGGYSGGVDTLDPAAPGGERPSPTESFFELAFLNAGGTVIGTPTSLDLRTEQFNGSGWAQHTLNGLAPAGAASVRVTASAIDMVPNVGSMSAFYDTFSLRRAGAADTEILANGDLNVAPDPIVAGWDTSGPHSYEGFAAHSGGSGFFLQSYQGFPEPLDATLLQTLAATPGTTYQFSGWSLFYPGYSGGVETLDPGSPYGEVPSLTETLFVMEFLNGSGTQIGEQTLDLRTVQMNDTTWREHVLTGLAPAGTTQVRVGVRVDDVMTNVDIPFQTANFDDFSLIAVLAGDYNQNGTVDAADYTVWRDHQGQTFTLTNENPAAATPSIVDAEDYAFWKSQFGDSAGSGSSATATSAVPEPTTFVLLMLVATGWCVHRGRAA